MMKWVAVAAMLASSVVAINGAEAKGCIRGALVGGVAGHFAGHHGLLGAAAGCAVGHHYANKRDRQAPSTNGNTMPDAQNGAPAAQ